MKNKTHRATAKRLYVSGSGKIRRRQTGMRHLMPHKSQKQKRHLRKSALVAASDLKRIKKQISGLK